MRRGELQQMRHERQLRSRQRRFPRSRVVPGTVPKTVPSVKSTGRLRYSTGMAGPTPKNGRTFTAVRRNGTARSPRTPPDLKTAPSFFER